MSEWDHDHMGYFRLQPSTECLVFPTKPLITSNAFHAFSVICLLWNFFTHLWKPANCICMFFHWVSYPNTPQCQSCQNSWFINCFMYAACIAYTLDSAHCMSPVRIPLWKRCGFALVFICFFLYIFCKHRSQNPCYFSVLLLWVQRDRITPGSGHAILT